MAQNPKGTTTKHKDITASDALEFMNESSGKAVSAFEKNFAEILKLLEQTRSICDDRVDGNNPAISAVAANIAADERARKHAAIAAVAETNNQPGNNLFNVDAQDKNNLAELGLMRKPLRVIWQQLCKRIDLLKNSQSEWEAFEQKIGE